MNARAKLALLVAAGAAAAAVIIWKYKKSGDGADRSETSPPTAPAPAQPTRGGGGVQGVAVDPEPDGQLLLEGQVVDAAEKAVGGALVRIDSVPPRQVVTEADGSFAFDRLIGREYAVEASAGPRHAGPARVRLAGTSEPVILRLVDASSLEVRVRDAESRAPIGGATVELRGIGTMSVPSGADGVARLEGIGAGGGTLWVSAPGHAPVARYIETSGVAGQVEQQLVDLVRGAPVSGRVLDPAGKPVAGAHVLPDLVAEPFPVFDGERDAVATDAEGRWRIPALAGGTYRFIAYHAELAETATSPTAIDGASERTGIDIRMEPGAGVSGVVLGATGQPVAAAQVRAVTAGGGIDWRLRRDAISGADGKFRIAGLPRQPADVLALHGSGSSEMVRVDLGARPDQEIELRLSLTGTIAGTVVSGAGEPVAEAQVAAEPEWTGALGEREAWRARGVPVTLADAGGKFTFPGLPGGTYRVRAAHPGAAESALWMHAGARAASGDADVRVVLPAPGKVSGKVLFADGGAPEAFTVSVGGATPVAVASSDGSFTVRGTGGKQNVRIEGPQFAPKLVPDVNVPEGGAAALGTITVDKGRSVSGRVVDATGAPVAEAKVAAGALLTGGGMELNIPSEGFQVKETTTDAQGNFVLSGFGNHPLTVVAGHPTKGRAPSVQIPHHVTSARVELVLSATGGIEGVVTRQGQPLPGTVIIAGARAAMRSMFFVISGKDGSFAFDQLGAGGYLVQAMVGSGGSKPKDLHAISVTVSPGQRVKASIDVPVGPVSVGIVVQTEEGAPVPAAQVSLMSIEIDAESFAAMRDKGPPEGASGSMYIRMAMAGQPAVVAGLPPGRYTACAAPLPVDPNDPQSMQKLSPEIVEGLPMRCAPAPVAATPASQQVIVKVPAAWTKPPP